MINIASPQLGKEEEHAVQKVLRSGNLAQGQQVEAFEKEFAQYIGSRYAIAVTNGTVALHLSLLALGLKSGDEVIVSPFSFIASSNAVLYTGAKPVFVDIDPQTFNLDTNLIEAKITKKTKAIIPVHLYGLPANMNKINELAKKYKLAVIEDACQAHGAKIEKKTIGNLGILGCFSFYPTKNMTTGEGGIITTNSKNLTKHIQLLRSHGMPKKYYHSSLGYNFRMTDIAAAIGREQLKKLNEFNRKRQSNARLYMKHLSEIKGIITPIIPKGYVHVFHQFTIRVTPQFHISRDRLIKKFNDHNIYTEVYYPVPIHKQEIYKKIGYKDILSNAEKASLEVLSLPIHPGLKKKDILKIISIFK